MRQYTWGSYSRQDTQGSYSRSRWDTPGSHSRSRPDTQGWELSCSGYLDALPLNETMAKLSSWIKLNANENCTDCSTLWPAHYHIPAIKTVKICQLLWSIWIFRGGYSILNYICPIVLTEKINLPQNCMLNFQRLPNHWKKGKSKTKILDFLSK